MSQNVSTNPKERESLSGSGPIKPWSAEAEADKLMDELFSDIDHILDGGNRLPTEPAKPEYVSLKPIVIPQLSIPPAAKPSQEEEPKHSSIEPTDSKSSETLEALATPTSNSPPNRSSLSVERLLLVLGFLVLGGSLLLLLASKKKLTWPWPKPAAAPPVQKSQVSAEDAEFARYMERALKAIDAKHNAKQQATTPPGGTGTTNSALSPAPSNPQPASSQPQRVIERVYIPVYPPQAPVAPAVPQSVIRPTVPNLSAPAPLRIVKPSVPTPVAKRTAPTPSPVAKRTAPTPAPVAKRTAPTPAPVAKRTAPTPAPVAKRSVPASGQAAAPSTLPSALPSLPNVPPTVIVPIAPLTQSPASVTKHTLVGVMEQGERSAALFDVGGVTRYVYIGEGIADSGWTLVSVENQEAVIRRNGEVRSVYAGQAF